MAAGRRDRRHATHGKYIYRCIYCIHVHIVYIYISYTRVGAAVPARARTPNPSLCTFTSDLPDESLPHTPRPFTSPPPHTCSVADGVTATAVYTTAGFPISSEIRLNTYTPRRAPPILDAADPPPNHPRQPCSPPGTAPARTAPGDTLSAAAVAVYPVLSVCGGCRWNRR